MKAKQKSEAEPVDFLRHSTPLKGGDPILIAPVQPFAAAAGDLAGQHLLHPQCLHARQAFS